MELSKLFQPFVQADAAVTRNFGGSGLGLCISKKLMEQMQGDILVDKGVKVHWQSVPKRFGNVVPALTYHKVWSIVEGQKPTPRAFGGRNL